MHVPQIFSRPVIQRYRKHPKAISGSYDTGTGISCFLNHRELAKGKRVCNNSEIQTMNIPALNTGINGINQGLSNMRRDASSIAQATGSTGTVERQADVTTLVNLKMNALQVQASTKVVNTVSEMIGSLLDVTA